MNPIPGHRIFLVAATCMTTLAHAQHPERRGIGTLPLPEVSHLAAQAAATAAPAIDARRSLFVTDAAIVSEFKFDEVMTVLANGSPDKQVTKESLFNQWWDTANRPPGMKLGPNCTNTLNGFPFDCPRLEGTQITQSPFSTDKNSQYFAIALSNRFDLAGIPSSGATDCGEYRVVFARRSGVEDVTNRNFIIFEGVLPNPYPNGKDLKGCKPIADFWASLSTLPDQKQRAKKLKDFYFKGLPGFPPVIAAKSYGNATPQAKGQVRTNQFMQFNWNLRQFALQVQDKRLRMLPTTTADNPGAILFNESASHPQGSAFRKEFLDVVKTLAINDINRFNLNGLSNKFDQGQSAAGAVVGAEDYTVPLQGSPKFSAAIQGKLAKNTLTAEDIAKRAKALTCAGCHQDMNGESLGGGQIWPSSRGFVHTEEGTLEKSPDGGQRFVISDALTDVFLPHRKAVFQSFLASTP